MIADPAAAAAFYSAEFAFFRNALLLCSVGGTFAAAFFWASMRRAKARARLTNSLFKEVVAERNALRAELAAMQARIEVEKAEVARLDELRKRADEGCARKHSELEECAAQLNVAIDLMEHMRRSPARFVKPLPVLQSSVVDIDLGSTQPAAL